jgi:hypothetical protein
MNLEADIAKYYVTRFGPTTREAEFEPKRGPVIQVWKWDSASSKEGVAIYATLGASSSLVGDDRRCEFFLGLAPEADGVAESLAEVALHGTGTGKVPAPGDSVTLPEPLWPGTAMRSLLLGSHGEAIIPAMRDPTVVTFIQLVPLYAEELAYKKEHGDAALWNAFRSKTTPYWDPRRPPAL